LEVSFFLLNFASLIIMSKEISMKEGKPYPVLEEEDSSCMKASESAPALAYAEPYTPTEPPHIPGLPETWEELLDGLKEGEEEVERGEYFTGEEVFRSVRERIRCYAS
jgi:hypothetical protein